MSERRWFHGGVPGLEVGDELLPPSITGKSTLYQYAQEVEGSEHVRADRVFLTWDLASATDYAGIYPHGDVYEAIPQGEVEPDPDCTWPGLSIQCECATIIRVVRRRCPVPNLDGVR